MHIKPHQHQHQFILAGLALLLSVPSSVCFPTSWFCENSWTSPALGHLKIKYMTVILPNHKHAHACTSTWAHIYSCKHMHTHGRTHTLCYGSPAFHHFSVHTSQVGSWIGSCTESASPSLCPSPALSFPVFLVSLPCSLSDALSLISLV